MKSNYLKRVKTITASLVLASVMANADNVKSPGGNISVEFKLDNGVPVYNVSYKGQPVVKDSKLGLELVYGESLMNGFEVVNTEIGTFDETWKPVWGEVSEIRNH